MPTEAATERRALKAAQLGATPPIEQEHLPCPRCDSTNTKFCYYNNYNYSQPRHFCKSCRRYWTHGGTLRDIPIGGGTRRNSSKRSRTLPTSSTVTSSSSSSLPNTTMASGITTAACNTLALTGNRNAAACCSSIVDPIPAVGGPIFVSVPGAVGGPYIGDVQFSKMSSSGGPTGSFTSWLSGSGNGAGLLAFGGFGLGLGPGFEDTGLLTRGVWRPFQEVGYLSGGGIGGGMNGGGSGGEGGLNGNTWQLESGNSGFVGGDNISWPDLAISTPGNGVI